MPEFNNVEEVRAYAKDLLTRQAQRLDKYIRIEQLARLEKWVLEEVRKTAPQHQDDWPTVTLNEPRTLYNAIRRACGKYPITHRIQLPSVPTDEDLEEINLHERLLIGAWSEVDLLRRKRSQGRFQTDATWFAAHRGGVIVRPLIQNGAPFTPFRIEAWDPLAVLYEPGSTGPIFVAHFRMVGRGVMAEEYKKEDDADLNGNIAVMDAWWKGKFKGEKGVFNVILGPKTEFKGSETKDWGKEPFEDIPVHIIKTGSPAEQRPEGDPIGDQRIGDAWETIFDANEMMYAWLNRIASLYGIIIRNGAIGPYMVDEAIYRKYGDKLEKMLKPFGIIPGQIAGVTPPQMAGDAKEFFAFMQGAVQRGGVPYSSFGMIPFQLSGFGINQLQGGIEIAALPVSQILEDMYWLADDDILRQVRKIKAKFRVSGTDNAGKPFLEDIKGAKLDKDYIIQTSAKLALPQDELLQAQVAQLLDSIGVSKLTIFDEKLGIQDPHGEYQRRLNEDADRDPIVKGLNMATALLRAGKPETAKIILQAYVMGPLGAMGSPAGTNTPAPQLQPPEARGQGSEEPGATPPQNVSAETQMQTMGAVLGR